MSTVEATLIEDSLARARREPRLPKVAFVVSQFPETHETFILREFDALADLGLDFVIMSLKPCRDRIVQSAARRFLDRTYYVSGTPGAGAAPTTVKAVRKTARVLPWAAKPLECAYVAWAAGRFAQLAGRLGIGHIHAHWATAPASAAAVMSRILNVPYSFTAHAWDIYSGDGKLAQKARGARFVVTCTAANVRTLRSAVGDGDADKVILNYHGIPGLGNGGQRRASGDADESRPLRIAAVGRLVETKGYEYLIRALQGVPYPYELTIVGEGPLGAKLKALAAAILPAGCVRFAGTVTNEEVFAMLGGSDCLVMPSVVARDGDRDGIPNVILEAMAAGLPVVASNISGIPEAVKGGETGILVAERDSAAISAALERLSRDRRAARDMGERGRRAVSERFSAEANAAALYGVFERFGEAGGR